MNPAYAWKDSSVEAKVVETEAAMYSVYRSVQIDHLNSQGMYEADALSRAEAKLGECLVGSAYAAEKEAVCALSMWSYVTRA
jgi:hypothetical protein